MRRPGGEGTPLGYVAARFPLHELEALIGWPTAQELADELGVERSTVAQWRSRGLSWRQADELACRFDYHPALVWGGDWCEPYVPPDHPRASKPPRVRPGAYEGIGSAAELGERAARRLQLA